MTSMVESAPRIRTLRWADADRVNSKSTQCYLPVIDSSSYQCVLAEHTVWDQTPILDEHGNTATIDGNELWLFLCAPIELLGDERHFRSRLRLTIKKAERWHDAGYLLPQGFSRGTREWAATAYLEGGILTLYHTAAGDDAHGQFLQRIFKATANLKVESDQIRFIDWCDQGEVVKPDSRWYDQSHLPARFAHGIKAFRDPFWLAGDERNDDCLLIAATKVNSQHERDACIALAFYNSKSKSWEMTAPILDAERVSYEVERPHCLWYRNKLYVFWSIHGWTTSPAYNLPTGLYGMVGDSIQGPFRLLNDTGLVACNPKQNPFQAYSWFVAGDLSVSSFVDLPEGRAVDIGGFSKPRGSFVGAMAPSFSLVLNQDDATSSLEYG